MRAAFHKDPTPIARAVITCQLRGGMVGPQPSEQLLTTKQVQGLLHCSGTAVGVLGLPRIQCGPRGSGRGGRRPWLYRRADVERVITIRHEARIRTAEAARVVVAELEERL